MNLAEIFTDDSGKLSFSRTVGLLITVAYLLWATYIVIQTKQIPDIPYGLGALMGVLYGINKFSPKSA